MFTGTLLSLNGNFVSFWGYLIVFLALFIESLPFIGAVIPGGTLILIVSGILTKMGYFSLFKIIVVATLASILVDTLGYFCGRRMNKDRFHKSVRFLFIKKDLLERVGRIVHGHTGKALVFGRLNPVTRSMAPFIVGTENISFKKFFFFNVIGGILWVTMFIFLGYIFGASLDRINRVEHSIVIVTIFLVAGFYLYYIFTIFKNGGSRNGADKQKQYKKTYRT